MEGWHSHSHTHFNCAHCPLHVIAADAVEVGAWVAVTASFVVSEDSASAAVTSNLRLIGSIIGAMYGWGLVALINSGVREHGNCRCVDCNTKMTCSCLTGVR